MSTPEETQDEWCRRNGIPTAEERHRAGVLYQMQHNCWQCLYWRNCGSGQCTQPAEPLMMPGKTVACEAFIYARPKKK